jgi:hypothetical protein
MFLRNVSWLSTNYMALYPRDYNSTPCCKMLQKRNYEDNRTIQWTCLNAQDDQISKWNFGKTDQKHTQKIKLSLCLINYAPRHDDVWGGEVTTPSFMTSTLLGREWSASRFGRFALQTQSIGGWARRKAGQDIMEKRKITWPCQDSNPGRPARSQ